MTLTDRFARTLKQYRESAGLSQEELADRAGLDRTFVSQLERALKSPTLTTIEKVSTVLGIDPASLLRKGGAHGCPQMPGDYVVRASDQLELRRGEVKIGVSAGVLTAAVNTTHDMIDALYASDLDMAALLGLRNLSALVGEIVVASIEKTAGGLFRRNPHQDGYPDLLLMDARGMVEWKKLEGRTKEKKPFSPFGAGGMEIKSTCGSIRSARSYSDRQEDRPAEGDTRVSHLTGYDWKAHHRDTNNMVGVVWDFIERRPRVVAMFYANDLRESDWGAIVQPKAGGGRTTSVSIMNGSGIRKMYAGWVCVLRSGGYAEFFNTKNVSNQIPADASAKSGPTAARRAG